MDRQSSLLLHGMRIVNPDKVLECGWMYIHENRISQMGAGEPPLDLATSDTVAKVDATGQWVTPGFIDIHVHGGNGSDVMDGQATAVENIARFHCTHGTTGFLPTTLTAPVESLRKSLASVRQVLDVQSAGEITGACVLGAHLEGPFISPHKIGAQNPEYVQDPSVETMLAFITEFPGLVKKVTLAPERQGALELISWLRQQGIHSSLGHTDASYEQTAAAVEAGATHATHLFNAMRGLHHRDGGVVGACLLSSRVVCELIADGHHVDVPVMQLVLKTKDTKEIVLITDAISATGMPEGQYQLGGLDILVQSGRSVLASNGALAGSTLTMDVAVKNMAQRVGVSLPDAISMASANPAGELGLSARKGRLAPGMDADFVLLDDAMTVVSTFIQGKKVYGRS